MDRPNIFNGRLHAPFFIYFRTAPKLTDQQILARFGLATHRLTSKLQPSSTYAVIAEVGEWTLLADDWLYQLWHMPTTNAAIESLARIGDIFAWSVGECDQSYQFDLYRSGSLARRRIVDSPRFNDQVTRTDFGDELPFEAELLASDRPIEEKLHAITAGLGINPTVTPDKLRLYQRPYQPTLDPNAGIRNF